MATNFEIVFPCDKPITLSDGSTRLWSWDDIRAVCEAHNCRYILARHPRDTNPCPNACTFDHIHCGINTTSDNTYDNIAKWFGLATNSVNKIKGRFESTYALYLKHYNAKYDDGTNKPSIPDCDIYFNFKLDYDKLIGNIETADASENILLDIANGRIRRYEFKDKLSDAFRLKYDSKIKVALDIWNDKKMRGENAMNKRVVWIYGVAGVGKTELAKYLAKVQGYTYYMSDSGTNPFDNYADEPCLILDDVGTDNLNGKVVLKLFDPHNKCFTKARYYNKAIDAELIIVTSSIDPRSFWDKCRNDFGTNGAWEQLTRRLNGGVYHMLSKTSMECTMYDNSGSNSVSAKVDVPDDVTNKTVNVSAEARLNDAFASFGFTVHSDGSFEGRFHELPEQLELPFGNGSIDALADDPKPTTKRRAKK